MTRRAAAALIVLGLVAVVALMAATNLTGSSRPGIAHAQPSASAGHAQDLMTAAAARTPSETSTSISSAPPPDYDTGYGITVTRTVTNPWLRVQTLPGGNPELLGTTSLAFGFDGCPGLCSAPFVLDLTVGARSEGLIVGWEPVPCGIRTTFDCFPASGPTSRALYVRGETTGDLAAAWTARFGTAVPSSLAIGGDRWTVLRYPARTVALIVHADSVAAVSQPVDAGLTFADREWRLRQFLEALRFETPLPEPDPFTATIGALAVTMPGDWHVSARPNSLSAWSGGSFLSMRHTISVLDPDAALSVTRYTSSGSGADFVITGGTLAELAGSIDAGLGTSERVKTTIDGQPAYRWNIPSTQYAMRLTAMAVVEWKGRFYVFELLMPVPVPWVAPFNSILANVDLN